jgi:hypothetical protein
VSRYFSLLLFILLGIVCNFSYFKAFLTSSFLLSQPESCLFRLRRTLLRIPTSPFPGVQRFSIRRVITSCSTNGTSLLHLSFEMSPQCSTDLVKPRNITFQIVFLYSLVNKNPVVVNQTVIHNNSVLHTNT